MPKEKSAGVVVFRIENGRAHYLLLQHQSTRTKKRQGSHWDFPKGHVEVGETEEEAAKRETEEETGISNIKILNGFKEVIKYYFKARYNVLKKEKKSGSWIFKTVVFFLAETEQKEVSISFEHIGYAWLEYDKAIKKATYKNAKEILKKANQFLAERKYKDINF